MQVVKIFKSRPRLASKELNKKKSLYYLGFHPDPRWPFAALNGCTLDFVKLHLESFGGKVLNEKVLAALKWIIQVSKASVLLLNDSADLPEDMVDPQVGSIHCSNKAGLHFPLEMFPSALWVKICVMTEQMVIITFLCRHHCLFYSGICRSLSRS